MTRNRRFSRSKNETQKDRAMPSKSKAANETTGTAGPDVSQLKDETLAAHDFPGGRQHPFRVYFDPQVHRQIWEHALADTSVEICGVVVGRWHRDADGPFVLVSGSIRGQAAANKFAEVTFTHETWSAINAEMDSKFADQSIVGWYHTHPDFGIFLSDRDRFIQENFFSGAGQIALVVDPIRKTEGVFVWRDGKTELAEHYWVGDAIKTAPDNTRTLSEPHAVVMSTAEQAAPATNAAVGRSWWDTIQSILLGLLLFMLGFLMASRLGEWALERTKSEAIAIAFFSLGLRPGLETRLDELRADLRRVNGAVTPILENQRKLLAKATDQGEDLEKFDAARKELEQRMNRMLQIVSLTEQQYCLSPEQRELLEQLMQGKYQVVPQLPGKGNVEKSSKPSSPTGKSTDRSGAGEPSKSTAKEKASAPERPADVKPKSDASDAKIKDAPATEKSPQP